MSKITFRADEELIAQLEEFEASKSAIMREALRTYLNTHMGRAGPETPEVAIEDEHWMDHVVREHVEALIGEQRNDAFTRPEPQDINVNISVDGEPLTTTTEKPHTDEQCKTRTTTETTETNHTQCTHCGATLAKSHAYCPNCGEQSTQPDHCECGVEIDSNWSFCPDCGRRTPPEPANDR